MEGQSQEDVVTVGRVLHFVITNGKCRPAMVVEDWQESGRPGCVNLVVFPDGINDGKYGLDEHSHSVTALSSQETGGANFSLMTRWETSVFPNHATKAVRSWHWPRECQNLKQPAAAFADKNGEIHHHNHAAGIVDPHNCDACRALARQVPVDLAKQIPTQGS